jgi:hypothetical protein
LKKGENMKATNQPITTTTVAKSFASLAVLAFLIGILSLPGFASGYHGTGSQDEHKMHHPDSSAKDVVIGKKGVFHFTRVVKVGKVALQPGMYQVQHLEEGNDHVLVFKEVGMQAGYKHGNTPVGKEVARVKCTIEPISKKVSNTKITLRTNARGEREVAEVEVAGEAFKHILPGQSATSQAFPTGKKGMLHFTTTVKVGAVTLKPGMYQVQPIIAEGSEQVFVFNEVTMPGGYRMFNTPVGKEVARLTCTVEPVNKSVNNTKATLRTTAAGVKEVREIQIAGETIKHIL